MLDLRSVGKRYGEVEALDAVAFWLDRGVAAALTGPNGSGKTTLLRIAAGLERATSGEVRVGGHDPVRDGARARAAFGYAGHEPSLYEELTVRENVAFVAAFHLPAARCAAAVDEILARLGLQARADHAAGSLSRGWRQRAALARALVHTPGVLLLDEPFAPLDAEGSSALAAVLRERRQAGATVLFSTHAASPPLAPDRVLRLEAGRLVQGAGR